MVHEQPFDGLGKHLGLGQVAEPDGAPRHLVFIGRTDAAARGPNLVAAAQGFFAGVVEIAVERQDQRRVFRDA